MARLCSLVSSTCSSLVGALTVTTSARVLIVIVLGEGRHRQGVAVVVECLLGHGKGPFETAVYGPREHDAPREDAGCDKGYECADDNKDEVLGEK